MEQNLFGIDIGGTLAKVAFIDNLSPSSQLDFNSSRGTIHLTHFDSHNTQDLIEFLHTKNFSQPNLYVTGGGAFKYSKILQQRLNTSIVKIGQMQALHKGFSEVFNQYQHPSYTFRIGNQRQVIQSSNFPSLLCNIGSGVSIVKIGEGIQRIGGTSIGGGTVLGLATAILGTQSYQEILDLCQNGNASVVDLSYDDIYGNGETDALAVSLGRIAIEDPQNFRKEDIAKSLVNMVSYNIGHIASLAARTQGVNQVYFSGNFIKDHPYIMDRISFGLEFWSKGSITPLFLRHDGYFGAIGALVSKQLKQDIKGRSEGFVEEF